MFRYHELLTGARPIGAHRVKLDVSQYDVIGLQWVVAAAAGGASATIAIYASALPANDPRLANLDPTANPYWSLTPIVFASSPAAIIDSDFLPIGDNAAGTLLVVVTVAGADYTDFALLLHGAE